MISPAQIRAARNMINAKQSELAKAAGISLATLNNIERGIGDPRASTLESIRRALEAAGVTCEADDINESVSLNAIARPSSYDTFTASQRVLDVLTPGGLVKVQRILFFCRSASAVHEGEDPHRVCMVIEGAARSFVFDQVDFNMASGARAAEVAGIMYASYAIHKGKLFYLDQVQEDTTIEQLGVAMRRIRAMDWHPMQHPRDFFNVFDDWDGRISAFAERKGHPLRDLVAMVDVDAVLG